MPAPTAQPADGRPPRRARTAASIALAILAAVAVRDRWHMPVRARGSCSTRTRSPTAPSPRCKHEPVRRVVAREIVVQVIDRSSPRPDRRAPADHLRRRHARRHSAVPRRDPYSSPTRRHRLLFDRGGNVVVQPRRRRHRRDLRAAHARAERRRRRSRRNIDAQAARPAPPELRRAHAARRRQNPPARDRAATARARRCWRSRSPSRRGGAWP